MSLLYPRTISVRRANVNNAVGAQGYGGLSAANETVLFTGLSAAIQNQRPRGKPDPGLPSDAYGISGFDVLIPLSEAPTPGSITERDIIVDDTNKRYQVVTAYWTPLGFNLYTILLEA